jgi:hypothetical protein
MFDETKIAEIIQAQCLKWYYRMPEGCKRFMDVDDLLQEARIADIRLREKYDPAGASYTTVLWKDLEFLMMRFYKLYASRGRHLIYNYDTDLIGSNVPNPEKDAMVLDFVDKVCDISEKYAIFTGMVVSGIPPRLRIVANRGMKAHRFDRGWPINTVQFRLNRSVIENYFDVKIERLRALFYNCL